MLLDSTRPIGKTLNTSNGRPETSAGVLPQWHVLRATYARELKVHDQLREHGIRTFIPMTWHKSDPATGKQQKTLVPAITGLVFAQATRVALDSYIRSFGDARPVNYYWDRTANRPLTVPDKAMEDFIAIASTMDPDLIYLTEISDKLREGQKVIVKEGPFKGVEGKVVRIRKSRRIMVEIPGMLAVASTYVEMGNVEII